MAKQHKGDVVVNDPMGMNAGEITESTTELVVMDDVVTGEVLGPEGEEEEEDSESVESTEETSNIRCRIRTLAQSISESYWELSELVARVHREKIFKAWNFKNFAEWVADEFAIGRRKAYNFVQIQNYFNNDLKKELSPEKFQLAVDTAKVIGWNKALLLATKGVITANNVDTVLNYARKDSLDELATRCKNEFRVEMSDEEKEKSDDNNTMKQIRKTFMLTTGQDDVVRAALGKAKTALREGATDSSALSWICSEYDASSGTGSLSDKLSQFERQLGLRIVATSMDLKKVLYGIDTLNELAYGGEDAEETPVKEG